ncbi:MAG: helix-turn-helix transcriptional regulator [Actinomycetota bacterium]
MLKKLRRSIDTLGILDDDLRRRLYLYVRKQARPVTRDEAANEVGTSVKLAAFHLDKLEKTGLLNAHYARKPGRSGPGAGRSSKFYEISELEIDVSIPERSYDFVGEILVAAIASEKKGLDSREAALRIAGRRGRQIGEDIRGELGRRRPGRDRALSAAEDRLAELGYEPYRSDPKTVSLHNCPFHRLARQAPELVCGINQAFIDGLLRGLGNESVEASLEPVADQCCVKLRSAR